jgi:hypothetical protein
MPEPDVVVDESLLEDPLIDGDLNETWDKVRCGFCGTVISLLTCDYIRGSIAVCKGGCK